MRSIITRIAPSAHPTRRIRILAVATAMGQVALAQSPGDALFQRFDSDGDGRVVPSELPNQQTFARFDVNRDGAITLEEYRQVIGGGLGQRPAALPAMPSISPGDVKKVTSGPEILKPGEVGIGRMIPDVSFADLGGKQHRLSGLKSSNGLVVAMTSATCPLSKRYLPSLAKLEPALASQGLALLLVNPFASETAEQIRVQQAGHAFVSPYLHDRDKTLTTALQAHTTTEVFLLDSTRTLVYRGALDDQYGVDYNLDAPRHRYLHDAIAALLKNEAPIVAATVAPGCELDPGELSKPASSPVTYYRDVARILQQNCVSCHRDGGIAPFALDGIEEVEDRSRVIRRVVSEGSMPPWFAATADDKPNPWANDRSLSVRDKADLLAWIESGDRPPGDPADAPAKPVYPKEWSIGTPDLIIPLSRAYDVPATGFLPYQFDVVQTGLAEDKWVSAFEILPSERDVVHHVIVQVHEPGSPVRNLGEGAGGYWAVYVPGNGWHRYPEGFARKLPAGARVSFQIHYTPSGQAKQERLRLGLVFSPAPPQYEVKTVAVANPKLAIPPGVAHHVETRAQPVPFDIPVTSFMAHMHVRGKAFRYEVTYADGMSEILLDIPRYDFNWQLRYDLKQPKLIPRGSTVKVSAVFDNSAGNKANPDPSKLVRWGPQTVDEMMIGYLEYFTPLQ